MRGWNLLNRCLLLHPEINKTRDENVEKQLSNDQTIENTPVVDISTTMDEIANAGLNLIKGKAGTIMDRIIQEKMKQNGRQWQSELLAGGDRITNELTATRRLTSGVLVGQGQFHLGPNVLRQVQQRDDEKKTKEHVKAKRERIELSKNSSC